MWKERLLFRIMQRNHCGRCIGKCPFKAFENYTNGYRIYIGGRWGKKVAQGRYLDKVFTEKEEVLSIVEKAILLFREQGITGERFADTVAKDWDLKMYRNSSWQMIY